MSNEDNKTQLYIYLEALDIQRYKGNPHEYIVTEIPPLQKMVDTLLQALKDQWDIMEARTNRNMVTITIKETFNDHKELREQQHIMAEITKPTKYSKDQNTILRVWRTDYTYNDLNYISEARQYKAEINSPAEIPLHTTKAVKELLHGSTVTTRTREYN